jgi:allantoinase
VTAALEARARGVDISLETCALYLHFTEADMERLGAVAKCAPPLRSAAERESLSRALLRGDIDIVASDHSPAPASLKQSADFFAIWGGIAGVQSTLGVLLGLAPPRLIAALTAANPARRFAIPGKGRLAIGCDADFTLVDLAASHTVTRERLFQKHGLSPYLGTTFPGEVRRTVLRGETILIDGESVGEPHGRMVRCSNAKLGTHA